MGAKELLDSYRQQGGEARNSKGDGAGFLKFPVSGAYAEVLLGKRFTTQHGAAIEVTILSGEKAVFKVGADKPALEIKRGYKGALGLNKSQLSDATFSEKDEGKVAVIFYKGKAPTRRGRTVDTFDIVVRDAKPEDTQDLTATEVKSDGDGKSDDDLPF